MGPLHPPSRHAPPSNYYVIYLALMDEEWGRKTTTPFTMISQDLCQLEQWFGVVARLSPALFAFTKNLHRRNDLAARMSRVSHVIMTCYKPNFSEERASELDAYLAKVVYVQGLLTDSLTERLQRLRLPPLLIVDNETVREMALSLGFPTWVVRGLNIAELNQAIGNVFAMNPTALRGLGFAEDEMAPAVMVADQPCGFSFVESTLEVERASGELFLRPNEVLVNTLRGRTPPWRFRKRSDRKQAVERLVRSSHTIFGQKLVDYLMNTGDDLGCPEPIGDLVYRYRQDATPALYEELLGHATKHAPSHPDACNFGVCIPGVNRIIPAARLQRRVPQRILKYFFRQRSDDYVRYVERRDFRSEDDFKLFSVLATLEAGEYRFLSAMLSLYAVAGRIPILRSPQVASRVFTDLRRIYELEAGHKEAKLQQAVEQFCTELAAEINEPVRTFLRETHCRHVKVFSDLPIEWVRLDEVPLMFQRPVSRIPLTPGNLIFTHYQHSSDTLWLGPEQLDEIVILNCMEATDPLHEHAVTFSDALIAQGIRSIYADVRTVADYREALHCFRPFLLFHWGHGSYDRVADRGYLHIGRERTEVWAMEGFEAPPVVVLAACETAAMAATHNTPSNGWLSLGARSVLGTFLRVDADLTTVLLTRLVANLADSVRGGDRLETWASVVSKTLLLNRYLDFLYSFDSWRRRRKLSTIPREVVFEYTFLWNYRKPSVVEGYKQCPQILREAIAHFHDSYAKDFDRFLAHGSVVPHTMFFTHLGSPETIRIRHQPISGYDQDSPSHAYWQRRRQEIAESPGS